MPQGPEGRVVHQRREAVPDGVSEKRVMTNRFFHDLRILRTLLI